jgi:hypothetical protein
VNAFVLSILFENPDDRMRAYFCSLSAAGAAKVVESGVEIARGASS